MHKKMQAVFDEGAKPKHCCRKRTFEAMNPIGQFAANLRRQMAEYRALIMDLETQPDFEDRFRGKLEYMMQPIDAGDRIAGELTRITRETSALMVQIEKVFTECKADVEDTIRRTSAPAATSQ